MTSDGPGPEANPQTEVTLEQKVALLSEPAAYPGAVGEVVVKETHMSWVFLAGDHVYKLKKPVKYPFLDFSTLAAREADCRAELNLNRRLARDVYLGVVPLVRQDDGCLAIASAGEPVDWLVLMRRLSADDMLDHAIAQGRVAPAQVQGLAQVLARFYQEAEPADVTPDEYVAHFAREQETNRSILTDDRFGLPPATLNAVLSGVEAMLVEDEGLLRSRAVEGRIRDGHGDLRPEHVCLNEPPVIIDCLEFSRRLRLVDPFDELSFLGMECERLGAGWIGRALIAHCAGQLDDEPHERLLTFYVTYRACLRARLALAHLLEPRPREPAKWLPLARAYLAIAERSSTTPHR